MLSKCRRFPSNWTQYASKSSLTCPEVPAYLECGSLLPLWRPSVRRKAAESRDGSWRWLNVALRKKTRICQGGALSLDSHPASLINRRHTKDDGTA